MNNLKKLGVTALAGSLAAVSAQAGEMSMNGSANMTYYTTSKSEGKGIGTDKGLTVSGSGELDNGWTFSIYTYISDAIGISSHATSLTMGSLGTITAGQAFGGNSTSYDEEVPQAYEQTSDRQQNSANQVGNWMDNGGLTWVPPAFEIDGLGSVQAHIGFSPDADDAATNNGSVGTKSGTWGAGTDLGLTLSTDMGLTLGAYVAEREQESPLNADGDDSSGSWYATYTMGSVSVGYSQAYYDSGASGSATAATTAKAIGTSDGYFSNQQMSVAFNVNDNLSVSYGETWSKKGMVDPSDNENPDKTEIEAINIAYTMGAASLKFAHAEMINGKYNTANDFDATTIALSLAF